MWPTKTDKKKIGRISLLTSIGVRGYNRGTVQVIVHYLDKKKGAKKDKKKISIRAK